MRDRGVLSTGEIAAHLAPVSRPGISRHLRVLRECGVVTAHRAGKSQNHVLDPRPLTALRDGWLADFGGMQMRSLQGLRRRAESKS